MRIMTALVATTLLALPACKDDAEEIGKFTVDLNGNNMEFISTIDSDGRSSIRTMSPGGVKLILIDGFAGTKDGEPDLPVISMSLQSGITNNSMSLSFVQVFDESYETVLSAEGQFGQKQMENLTIGDDGSISFDFSADLVRITTQSEEPIADADGAHIEGHFSGKIPASEQQEK